MNSLRGKYKEFELRTPDCAEFSIYMLNFRKCKYMRSGFVSLLIEILL